MVDRQIRVVYWNNIPSPYFVERLNTVVRRENVSVSAWFNAHTEFDRSWYVDSSLWEFEAFFTTPRSILDRTFYLPPDLDRSPDLIVSLYGDPSFALGALTNRSRASRIAFRVLPTFDSWEHRARSKELIKHSLFRSIDAVKVPGDMGANIAYQYGVPDNRIFRVTQSIDVRHYATAQDVSEEERASGRRTRGLHGCCFIYVGRLWQGKGLDFLFDAYELLLSERNNVSLLIVGDGVDEQRYHERAAGLPGVHFEGFVQEPDIPAIYALADAMVFPTLGDPHGLVVEEAMAAGLPVVSSSAAGDIHSRLPDGHAGWIVAPGVVTDLAERMARIASDERVRKGMGRKAYALALSRDHERYAEDFEAFVEGTLRLPKRNSWSARVARGVGRLTAAVRAH